VASPVIISHRFSTVRRADHVVVIDGSLVVEEGTLDDLMARRYYTHVFTLQASRFADMAETDGNRHERAGPIRQLRAARTIVAMPFRAAPMLAWVTLAVTVVPGVAAAIVPLGAARFVNGVVADSSVVRNGAVILALNTMVSYVTTAL